MSGVTAVPPRLARFFEPDSPTQQLARALRRARAIARTSSAGACATRCSTGRDGYDIDITTDAPSRRDRARSSRAGPTRCGCRASASARSACEKDGERFEITTFRAEVYHPDSRKPEVTFARRHRDRPLAPRLHGQRDGARARRARARRPVRRARRSRGAPAAHAARARGLVRRRPAAHAARRRGSSPTLGFEPDAAMLVARSRRCAIGSQIISAERIRDELSKLLVADDPTPGPLAHRAHAAVATSSCPSSTRCSSNRIRSTGTRTCSRTRSRSSRRRRPS